ncbi:MAG: hypothetical protein U9Q77_13010 [Candidatus Marinimicrobia bacterium]|nr:hypothetical protein [Candidatus Neomarinimicrobiota bacterium]
MRKLIIVMLSLIFVVSVNAQGSGIGVGISTDGLTGKYWMNGSTAIAVHWNLGSSIAADYLLHKPEVLNITDAPTPVYYGAGVAVGTHTGFDDNFDETTEFDLSVRGVVGVSYYVSSFPVDIFLESTPTLHILGGGGLGFGGAFGFRYFF